MSRREGSCLETVIASEAKQSMLPRSKCGLLRRLAPRNDGALRYDSTIPRREAPEFCKNHPPSKTEGAGNAGRSMHPQPRVRNKTKHTSVVTTVKPEITRHSPRNGFYGL